MVFRENVKNNELAVNPLGLTIVRFRADRHSARDSRPAQSLFMSFHAPNPANSSDCSSCPVDSAPTSFSTRNYRGELRPSYAGTCRSNRAAIAVNFRSQCADENFALDCVCRYIIRLLLSHSFGAFPAPAALDLLLRIARPFGVSFLPKQV